VSDDCTCGCAILTHLWPLVEKFTFLIVGTVVPHCNSSNKFTFLIVGTVVPHSNSFCLFEINIMLP
jgi:hypothetical protein